MPGEATLIVTTRSGVRPLGVRGEPLHNAAPQLRRVVRRRLGDETADLLADPQPHENDKGIDWYAVWSGPVRRVTDLPPDWVCARTRPSGPAADSAAEESHGAEGLLEYPHYTRPAEWQGRAIPDVLLSGHHAEIARWRRAESERITRERRPDLWARHEAKQRGAGGMDGHPAAA